MKKTLTIIALFALSLSATAMASTVSNIQLTYENQTTVATITLDGPIRFSHETVEAKEGKPYRVLVDVLSAEHGLPQKDYHSVPNCVVSSVRTAQYAVSPEQVVRIVFDMKSETVYRVDSEKNWIKLYFADKSIPPFAAWSAKAFKKAPAAKKQPSIAKSKVSSPKTVASINNKFETDRQASLQNKKSTVAAKPGQPAVKKEKVAAKPVVATKSKSQPVVKSPTAKATAKVVSTPDKSVKTASVSNKSGNQAKKPMAQITPPKVSKSSVKKASKLDIPYGPDFVDEPESNPLAKAASKPSKPAVKASPKKESSPKSQLAQAKPEVPVKKAQPEKSVAKKAEPQAQKKTVASTPAKKVSKPKATVASKPSSKAKKPAAKPAVKAKKKSSPAASATKTVAKADKKDDKKSTSRFRRNPTGPTKIKGTLVAEFPKRLVIKYKGRSRDPFETLINDQKVDNDPIERRVPNVEGLKLVGIIEAEGGENRALFEDKSNFGYILKAGDKVQKGYVLRVEDDRVYFQIFEYGWSRTVALNIEEN